MTPVHYDPYINLFRLASTSSRYAGKHFLILPPTESINEALRPGDGTGQRNTSSVEFELVRDGPSLDAIKVDVVSDSLNDDSKELIKKEAFGVTLKVGEMLLLPHRWWHRAENIGTPQCWTAGVGYWFRAR